MAPNSLLIEAIIKKLMSTRSLKGEFYFTTGYHGSGSNTERMNIYRTVYGHTPRFLGTFEISPTGAALAAALLPIEEQRFELEDPKFFRQLVKHIKFLSLIDASMGHKYGC